MNFHKDPKKLEILIKKGAKYAITNELNDTSLYSSSLGDFIGEYTGEYTRAALLNRIAAHSGLREPLGRSARQETQVQLWRGACGRWHFTRGSTLLEIFVVKIVIEVVEEVGVGLFGRRVVVIDE